MKIGALPKTKTIKLPSQKQWANNGGRSRWLSDIPIWMSKLVTAGCWYESLFAGYEDMMNRDEDRLIALRLMRVYLDSMWNPVRIKDNSQRGWRWANDEIKWVNDTEFGDHCTNEYGGGLVQTAIRLAKDALLSTFSDNTELDCTDGAGFNIGDINSEALWVIIDMMDSRPAITIRTMWDAWRGHPSNDYYARHFTIEKLKHIQNEIAPDQLIRLAQILSPKGIPATWLNWAIRWQFIGSVRISIDLQVEKGWTEQSANDARQLLTSAKIPMPENIPGSLTI